MDFMGKICPYCKTEFKEDDEVVICSVCEMPHHKECWIENSGCTTFGCTGTIMGVDNYNNGLVCRKCGAAYTEGQRFCGSCGNVLLNDEKILMQQKGFGEGQQVDSYYSTPDTDYNSYQRSIDEDMKIFIGANEEYYFERFQKGSKVSWNWSSAFWGSYWYAYRRMYLMQFLYYVSYFLYVILLCLITFGIFFHTRNVAAASVVTLLVALVLPFVFSGILGNYLYKRHVEKHVKRARSMEGNMKEAYLRKKGGTSNVAVWTLIGLQVLPKIISAILANL